MSLCEWAPHTPREFADQLAELQREAIEITTKFHRLGYQLTELTFKGQAGRFTVIGPSGAVDVNFEDPAQELLDKAFMGIERAINPTHLLVSPDNKALKQIQKALSKPKKKPSKKPKRQRKAAK